jgi:hypothetical protein
LTFPRVWDGRSEYPPQSACAGVDLTALASRDFLRAAVRLCRAPRDTALSIWRAVARSSLPAASALPLSAEVRTLFVELLSTVRIALLRVRRLSF